MSKKALLRNYRFRTFKTFFEDYGLFWSLQPSKMVQKCPKRPQWSETVLTVQKLKFLRIFFSETPFTCGCRCIFLYLAGCQRLPQNGFFSNNAVFLCWGLFCVCKSLTFCLCTMYTVHLRCNPYILHIVCWCEYFLPQIHLLRQCSFSLRRKVEAN